MNAALLYALLVLSPTTGKPVDMVTTRDTEASCTAIAAQLSLTGTTYGCHEFVTTVK